MKLKAKQIVLISITHSRIVLVRDYSKNNELELLRLAKEMNEVAQKQEFYTTTTIYEIVGDNEND